MVRDLHRPEAIDRGQRVACVTGGAGNIGRAVATRLALDGYAIVTTVYPGGGRPEQPGDPVATSREAGRELGEAMDWTVVECDLADPADCSALVALIESGHGRLDCLVNNAATWTYARLSETTDEDWRGVFEVNVFALVRLARAARHLLGAAPAARIVNIGSSCGFLPEAGVGPYCVSKAAVHALTGWLAIELSEDGVAVNAVAPGYIDTTTNVTYHDAPRALQRRLESIPAGRPGTVDEVAHVVSFLASEQLGFVTGTVVRCDGGFLSGASQQLFST